MKRGSTEGLSVIISIVLCLLILFIFGYVYYLSFSEKAEAKKGFENFVDFLKELSEEGKSFEGERPIYVHRDFIIVGFNGKDIETSEKGCYGWIMGNDDKNLRIKKPSFCGSQGCLCLCEYGGSVVFDEKILDDRYKDIIEGQKQEQTSSDDYVRSITDEQIIAKDYRPIYDEQKQKLLPYKNNIFVTGDVCTNSHYCLKGGIEGFKFLGMGSGGDECNFFFIPGIIREDDIFIERGLDEIYLNVDIESNDVSLGYVSEVEDPDKKYKFDLLGDFIDKKSKCLRNKGGGCSCDIFDLDENYHLFFDMNTKVLTIYKGEKIELQRSNMPVCIKRGKENQEVIESFSLVKKRDSFQVYPNTNKVDGDSFEVESAFLKDREKVCFFDKDYKDENKIIPC